ncbi:hypothetical protein V8C86DRAFT_3135490 [Haematococcus lacustris]
MDPLEQYCEGAPDADECRVYDMQGQLQHLMPAQQRQLQEHQLLTYLLVLVLPLGCPPLLLHPPGSSRQLVLVLPLGCPPLQLSSRGSGRSWTQARPASGGRAGEIGPNISSKDAHIRGLPGQRHPRPRGPEKPQIHALSQVSSKPTSLATYRRFADTVMATYGAVWAEISTPRWANASFRLYRGKQRVVAGS